MLGHSMFNPMSPQALAISNLTIVLMIISGAIVLGIMGVLVYTMIRYRRRAGQTGEPPQQFGVVKLEIAWTAIPFALVLILFGASIATMKLSSPPGGDPPDNIVVIGHQWWWEIRYPSGVVTANEIHLPVGKRMLVLVKSVDVIHSLWIPQLGGKMDLVPGQTNSMYLEADKPGIYEGNCVEYCGDGHAWMLIRAIAQSPAQFAAWERQQLSPPTVPTSGPAAAGAKLFAQLTCQSCHTEADIGPDLSHFATRQTLAAGRLLNTPANVRAWLADPGQIKPGVHMPNFHLSPSQLTDLTAYLESTGGTASAAPPSATPAPTAQHFLTWNTTTHTARLTLVAALTGALGGFNFDGYGHGQMVVRIPTGYRVTVTFSNKAAVPHSALVTSYAARNAAANFTLAFPGASVPNPANGITAGKTQQFSFTATKPGTYAIVCGVPGHAEQGMWDVLTVTRGGQPALTVHG